MKTYGYIRVSTKEQNEDRQLIAMREFGVPEENVIMDSSLERTSTAQVTKG